MTGAGAAEQRTASPAGARWGAWTSALAAGALAALWVANDAGVVGASALPLVLRSGLAAVAVFLVCGYAPAVLLTPTRLMPWWPLLVLPFGTVTCGLALTVLGFAALPFHVALVLLLVAGIVAAARVERPPVDAGVGNIAALACVAALVVAVALVPTFRSGLATVTGFGSDAHLVAGSATFLQHNYPASTNPAYPADQVPPLWRSKFPIYYALSAVSSVGGVESWQALMTVAAILLALAGVGFFLLARDGFGMPVGVAAAAMVAAVLDRRVFHLALHPYYNQLWGMLTLPFTILAGYLFALMPSRRTLGMLVVFGAVGAFAYPLMLPFSLLPGLGAWLMSGRRIALPRFTRRQLIWIVPVVVLLIVPIIGVLQKIGTAVDIVFSPADKLIGWQGDLQHYPAWSEFFSVGSPVLSRPLTLIVVLLGYAGLWRAPRQLGRPLIVVLTLALIAASFFDHVKYGQYFYFKVLSFTGPQIVVAAVCLFGGLVLAAGSLPLRALSVGAIALLCLSALLSARDEIKVSYDQLTPETIQLRDWASKLPAGASIRLDTPRSDQLWQAYMLSSHPLGSRDPITNYPHVPYSAGADYVLDEVLAPPPEGAVFPPVDRNASLRLWKLKTRAPDTTSRRMVPNFSGNR